MTVIDPAGDVTGLGLTDQPDVLRFPDRHEAGRTMAPKLSGYKSLNPVVIGIAPDAMPIAAEIASALEAPLDTVAVSALAIDVDGGTHVGSTAEGGVVFYDPDESVRIEASPEAVDATLIDTQRRLERQTALWHRGVRRRSLSRRNVLLVGELLSDELVAAAAACAVRDRGATQVTYAAPKVRLAAAMAVVDWMDEIVCLETTARHVTSSDCFEHSEPVSDEEIRSLLHDNETAQRLLREREAN